MSDINLLRSLQNSVTFTRDLNLLHSSEQTSSYITPGVSALPLYSKYIPTTFNENQIYAPFVSTNDQPPPAIIGVQNSGEKLAKPHVDIGFSELKSFKPQVGHGEPSTSNYKNQLANLIDKFNNPYFDTEKVRIVEPIDNLDQVQTTSKSQSPCKRKITKIEKEKVPRKKPRSTKQPEEDRLKTEFDREFFDFSKI